MSPNVVCWEMWEVMASLESFPLSGAKGARQIGGTRLGYWSR
jgi:hypothetical protein